MDLTKEQRGAVNTLKRLGRRWPEGIWLYCTGTSISVFKCGEDGEHVMEGRGGSPDVAYRVDSIYGIDHDGGDF